LWVLRVPVGIRLILKLSGYPDPSLRSGFRLLVLAALGVWAKVQTYRFAETPKRRLN
jgi:hypothetical protein